MFFLYKQNGKQHWLHVWPCGLSGRDATFHCAKMLWFQIPNETALCDPQIVVPKLGIICVRVMDVCPLRQTMSVTNGGMFVKKIE